ncbi:hypothetical protein A2U01_0108130, partial [Trifolium medium]|nr:hypothetical protein [Trifolium medium]
MARCACMYGALRRIVRFWLGLSSDKRTLRRFIPHVAQIHVFLLARGAAGLA